MGQVHLGWAKLSWIVHGALTHGSYGNERSWVLGFNLNPPHYIKMSLVGEIETSVCTQKGKADFTRENQSILILKVIPSVHGVV